MHTTTSELMFLGARCRILANAETTDGRYGLVEMIEVPAGDMPPLHVHREHDECFVLLDGELSLFLPGREVALAVGEFFRAPRGIPHAYRVGDRPARFLVMSDPSGFEDFVRDVAHLQEQTPEAVTAAAAGYDIEILGPPGTRP